MSKERFEHYIMLSIIPLMWGVVLCLLWSKINFIFYALGVLISIILQYLVFEVIMKNKPRMMPITGKISNFPKEFPKEYEDSRMAPWVAHILMHLANEQIAKVHARSGYTFDDARNYGYEMADVLAAECEHCTKPLGFHEFKENTKTFECTSSEQSFKMIAEHAEQLHTKIAPSYEFIQKILGVHP